jgi:hypothetical protein
LIELNIKYEELEYSHDCSEIIKGTRDVQLAPDVNTIFDCSIETIQLYQDNIVEILLRFRLQSYPELLLDKYTFLSQQRYVIKDTYGAFYINPWDNTTVELFAHIYVDGQKKFVNEFKSKLVEMSNDFYKNEPIVYNENTKRVASQILQFYAQ